MLHFVLADVFCFMLYLDTLLCLFLSFVTVIAVLYCKRNSHHFDSIFTTEMEIKIQTVILGWSVEEYLV